MECTKCKKRITSYRKESTLGWVCPSCSWSIVTSYFDEIDIDRTDYNLYITGVPQMDTNKIRCVSNIAGVNFITAKEMIKRKDAFILRAKAAEIKDAIDKLSEAEISYRVEPPFNY